MLHTTTFRKSLLASALGVLIGSAQANAETVLKAIEVTETSYAPDSVQIGAFRDQSPLDVPLTNNVINRNVLDAQGASSLYQALRNTAGVTRHQLSGGAYDNISIRGILVENRGNYRLNGSLPIINLVDIPLENKERVEVLKGASSFYYGMIPPSGVVNFVTKRAGKTPVTSVAVVANQHGTLEAHVDAGRRFGDFGIRVNALKGKNDNGIDRYDGDRGLVSVALDWQATPGFNLKLDAEHYAKEVTERAPLRVPAAVGGVITLPPKLPNTHNLASEWMKADARATNVLLRGDVSLTTDWILTLEMGRAVTQRDRNLAEFGNYNLATGAGTLFMFITPDQEYINTNYRAEVFGQFSTGPLRHELTLGTTANKREQAGTRSGSPTFTQNLYAPVTIAPFTPVLGARSADSQIDDRGLYLLDRISLSEQWQVLAGVRHSDYESRTTGVPANTIKQRETTPNASLIFRPTPNTSVYASYLEGLEITRPVPPNASNAGQVLPPALSRQKEIGAKAKIANGLLIQAAAFQFDGRPVTGLVAGPGSRFDILGESRFRGVELSASGELSPRLSLVASATWLDAEIVRALNAAEVGKTPEGVPDNTTSLFGEYRIGNGLSLNAGLYRVGKRQVNNLNQGAADAYTLLSLGAGYQTRLGTNTLKLQANLDNAADTRYWEAASGGYLSAGMPRTLRLSAKLDF